MIHAELKEYICIGHSDLTRIENDPSLAYLPDGWNEDFLWRKYENGAWSVEKFMPPEPVPQPSAQEQIDKLKDQLAITNATVDFLLGI